MTDHEQPAAGVALKRCPGFNPDLSSRGEGDCLNCGRHQSEHAPNDAGGAVSEGATDDPLREFIKRVMVWRLSDYDKTSIKGAMALTVHQIDVFCAELAALASKGV